MALFMAFHCAVGYHPTEGRGPKPSPISNAHTDILEEKKKTLVYKLKQVHMHACMFHLLPVTGEILIMFPTFC